MTEETDVRKFKEEFQRFLDNLASHQSLGLRIEDAQGQEFDFTFTHKMRIKNMDFITFKTVQI